MEIYALTIFINELLLSELNRNLPKVSSKTYTSVHAALKEIAEFTVFIETIPIFTNSPDSKDNFLFDLAIQTNSEVIVTQENALLNFAESPVLIHDIKWFKETFPIPL